MTHADAAEIVSDPVAHISISGVHGREELDARLAHPPRRYLVRPNPVAALLVGAVIGATVMYFATRD